MSKEVSTVKEDPEDDTWLQLLLARSFKEGLNGNKNEARALSLFLSAANNGSAEAQFEVGLCYEFSCGAVEDFEDAFRWYLLSANHGNREAECRVGVMYQLGRGVKKDINEAFKWYTLSAGHGFHGGQFRLAELYNSGEGVTQSSKKALKWYKLAAEQGNAEAQAKVGFMLYEAYQSIDPLPEFSHVKAIVKNLQIRDEAEKWLRLAANQGHRKAQATLASFLRANLNWDHHNSWKDEAEQVLQGLETSKWSRLAAEQGDMQSQRAMGDYCLHGKNGVSKDPIEAVRWYRLSAEQGSWGALLSLGKCYQNGDGVDKDLNEAFRLFQLSADTGLSFGLLEVIRCYDRGEGVAQNTAKAIELFEEAVRKIPSFSFQIAEIAEEGSPELQCYVGIGLMYPMYPTNCFWLKNVDQGVKMLRKAADKGLAQAQCELALLYQGHPEWENEPNESLKWFCLAANQGHVESQIQLSDKYADGAGVPLDDVLAYMWANLAAVSGNEIARKKRSDLTEKMSKEQVAEAQRLCRDWRPSNRSQNTQSATQPGMPLGSLDNDMDYSNDTSPAEESAPTENTPPSLAEVLKGTPWEDKPLEFPPAKSLLISSLTQIDYPELWSLVPPALQERGLRGDPTMWADLMQEQPELFRKRPFKIMEDLAWEHLMRRKSASSESHGINLLEGPLDEEAKKLGRELLVRITNHQPSTVKGLYEEFLQLYKIPADGLRGSNGNRAWHCLVAMRETPDPLKSKLLRRIEAVLLLSLEKPEEAWDMWVRQIDNEDL
jgi:TPR repeat protein